MTLLATLRHAETEWSRDKRIQGRSDVPLSAVGRAALRAHALPALCAGMRAVTSPLARCVETAALLGHAQAQREPRIAEMHWGAWEGRRIAALRATLGAAMQANEARGMDFTPEGGESPRRVLERLRPWLAEIAAQAQPTLAFTHRGVIRVLLAEACGWDMLGRPPAKLDWGAVHVFRLDAQGRPQVDALNVALEPRGADAEPRA
jgi:broad specificity phosphatase PhoE